MNSPRMERRDPSGRGTTRSLLHRHKAHRVPRRPRACRIGLPGATMMGVVAVFLLLGAAPAEGQSGIRIVPQAGSYTPLSELGEVRDGAGAVMEAGRRSSSLAWGLSLEFGDPGATSFRAQAAYATAADVPVRGFDCVDCVARSTLLTVTAAALLRPLPRLLLVQPYLVLGGGVKRYDFDPEEIQGDGRLRELFDDQLRPAAQLGVGAETRLPLLGLGVQVELTGVVSRYRIPEGTLAIPLGGADTDLQTDLFLTVGIPLGG